MGFSKEFSNMCRKAEEKWNGITCVACYGLDLYWTVEEQIDLNTRVIASSNNYFTFNSLYVSSISVAEIIQYLCTVINVKPLFKWHRFIISFSFERTQKVNEAKRCGSKVDPN